VALERFIYFGLVKFEFYKISGFIKFQALDKCSIKEINQPGNIILTSIMKKTTAINCRGSRRRVMKKGMSGTDKDL